MADYYELSADFAYVYIGTSAPPFPKLRPEFKSLACRKCDRLDPRSLLSFASLPASYEYPRRAQLDLAFSSQDKLPLVSERFRTLLEEAAPGCCQFIPVQGTRHQLMIPSHVIEPRPEQIHQNRNPIDPPQPRIPFSVYGKACVKCGFNRNMALMLRWLELDSLPPICGILLEGRPVPGFVLIIKTSLQEAIQKAGLRGIQTEATDTCGPTRWDGVDLEA